MAGEAVCVWLGRLCVTGDGVCDWGGCLRVTGVAFISPACTHLLFPLHLFPPGFYLI